MLGGACIINVAIGREYPRGQDRLEASLSKFGAPSARLYWRNRLPPGSPSHQRVPYAFKPYAFRFAQRAGYELVLWLDAALTAIKPLGPIFARIESEGYFFPLNGAWITGQWCSDLALAKFGKTRAEAMQYPHIMACCLGLNLAHPLGRAFLDAWQEKADDGASFPGPWDNKNGAASSDPRVLGHRHDQTAASFVAYDLGMRHWDDNIVEYYNKQNPHPDAFFVTGLPFRWWQYRFAAQRRQLAMRFARSGGEAEPSSGPP